MKKLFNSGVISQTVYEYFDKELSHTIHEFESLKQHLKDVLNKRVSRLEAQLQVLEKILADIEISYKLGDIDKKSYDVKVNLISSGIKVIKSEIETLTTLYAGKYGKPKHLKPPKPLIKRKVKRKKKVKNKIKVVDRFSEDLHTYDDISTIDPDIKCQNPWNRKCKNKDIVVFIYYKNERTPICRECWSKIAEKDLEW